MAKFVCKSKVCGIKCKVKMKHQNRPTECLISAFIPIWKEVKKRGNK